VQNLVANAIRYTSQGFVRLRCLAEGDWIRIEVLDTGIGIPMAEHEAIFEDFYQRERVPGRKHEGLGLGLAIVRRLSRLLDLPVQVHSVPGSGSAFVVSVPRSERTTVARAIQPPAARARSESATILLLDDDPAVIAATRMLLQLEGYEVLAAATLEQALRLAATSPPDLVLSDFHLGSDVTGVEAISRLRGAATASLPAILVTGDTSTAVAAAPDRLGRCAVLSKPVSPDELLELIARMLVE
jgi:CheY-like chemotaxis protein